VPPRDDDVMSSRQELDHGFADGSGASNHDDAHVTASNGREQAEPCLSFAATGNECHPRQSRS
jgi:hypothetical protein